MIELSQKLYNEYADRETAVKYPGITTVRKSNLFYTLKALGIAQEAFGNAARDIVSETSNHIPAEKKYYEFVVDSKKFIIDITQERVYSYEKIAEIFRNQIKAMNKEITDDALEEEVLERIERLLSVPKYIHLDPSMHALAFEIPLSTKVIGGIQYIYNYNGGNELGFTLKNRQLAAQIAEGELRILFSNISQSAIEKVRELEIARYIETIKPIVNLLFPNIMEENSNIIRISEQINNEIERYITIIFDPFENPPLGNAIAEKFEAKTRLLELLNIIKIKYNTLCKSDTHSLAPIFLEDILLASNQEELLQAIHCRTMNMVQIQYAAEKKNRHEFNRSSNGEVIYRAVPAEQLNIYQERVSRAFKTGSMTKETLKLFDIFWIFGNQYDEPIITGVKVDEDGNIIFNECDIRYDIEAENRIQYSKTGDNRDRTRGNIISFSEQSDSVLSYLSNLSGHITKDNYGMIFIVYPNADREFFGKINFFDYERLDEVNSINIFSESVVAAISLDDANRVRSIVFNPRFSGQVYKVGINIKRLLGPSDIYDFIGKSYYNFFQETTFERVQLTVDRMLADREITRPADLLLVQSINKQDFTNRLKIIKLLYSLDENSDDYRNIEQVLQLGHIDDDCVSRLFMNILQRDNIKNRQIINTIILELSTIRDVDKSALLNYMMNNHNFLDIYTIRYFSDHLNGNRIELNRRHFEDLEVAKTIFSNMDLSKFKMRGNFSSLNLAKYNFSGCDMAEVDLRNADLSQAILSDANLEGADLREANLMETNLSNSNLSGANLTNVKNLQTAIISHGTKIDGIVSPKVDRLFIKQQIERAQEQDREVRLQQ